MNKNVLVGIHDANVQNASVQVYAACVFVLFGVKLHLSLLFLSLNASTLCYDIVGWWKCLPSPEGGGSMRIKKLHSTLYALSVLRCRCPPLYCNTSIAYSASVLGLQADKRNLGV